MFFRQVFDEKLAQYAYLIGCQATGEAIVIDPERDIDQYVKIATGEGLEIVAVTETHIHADFLSGSREFAEQHDVHVYLSDEGDADWKYEWVKKGDYNYTLLKDGDAFKIGNIELRAVHTPGAHAGTPEFPRDGSWWWSERTDGNGQRRLRVRRRSGPTRLARVRRRCPGRNGALGQGPPFFCAGIPAAA